jgi:hypothetical protein
VQVGAGKSPPEAEVTGSSRAANFLDMPFLEQIQPTDLDLGQLSRRFCVGNQLAPIRTGGGKRGVVVGNPLDWELLESLKQTVYRAEEPEVMVASPETIALQWVARLEGYLSRLKVVPEE